MRAKAKRATPSARVAALSAMQAAGLRRFRDNPFFTDSRTTGTILALDLRAGVLRREYRLSQHFVHDSDFFEGHPAPQPANDYFPLFGWQVL